MAKLTVEYRIDVASEQIYKLQYAIEKMKWRIKAKQAKVKAYTKKIKLLEKEKSASAPKVVSIKRGRRKAVA